MVLTSVKKVIDAVLVPAQNAVDYSNGFMFGLQEM
jgi:hypothetical protein